MWLVGLYTRRTRDALPGLVAWIRWKTFTFLLAGN
jgi:hypothetical protein